MNQRNAPPLFGPALGTTLITLFFLAQGCSKTTAVPVRAAVISAGVRADGPPLEAWENRADLKQLSTALSLWEEAREHTPSDPALLSKLTRGYFFLGEQLLATERPAEAATALEKAVEAGEHGLMGSSSTFADAVQGGGKVADLLHHIPVTSQGILYWYGVSLGRFASLKGFRTLLFYRDRLFAVMTRVLEIDETYFHGAPHRYFGAYYAQAPAFVGGDLAKAKHHFERALKIAPDFLGTKVAYAEYYATKANNPGLFKQLLSDVLSSDPGALPKAEPEQILARQRARTLLGLEKALFQTSAGLAETSPST